MRRALAAMAAAGVLLAGLSTATHFIAAVFAYQPSLGPSLVLDNGRALYPPWAVLAWRARWSALYPKPFAIADLVVLASTLLGLLIATMIVKRPRQLKPVAKSAWASPREAGEAGLFASQGAILGALGEKTLAYDGPGHLLLIGASRSGKGRGQIVPTLLACGSSMLVLDAKGELADGDPRHDFPGTAGFRERLGPVLRFAPTRPDSAAFNPLFEVRRGASEVRDVQNIVEILVDPRGDGRNQDFWDRSAKTILVGLILHVLYAEPAERKTLQVVREKLRDLDATAQQMKSTLHRLNPASNLPEVHPEVLHAAESFLAGEERLQSGVKATAESFFGLFADELVGRNTARSDFRIGDLMCGEKPVTLYLQPPPSDALRLMPLLRLLINQFARALMEDQTKDAMGRQKRHRLMLVLDEFPMLGRMPFFETMMGAMAGYGLQAFLVTQSLNHLSKAYGRDNVILDNCHIVTSFAAADGDTAKRIADMAGEVWELRESETVKRPAPLLSRAGSTTTREERRPLLLPADVRALDRDQELIFVAGAKPIRASKLKFDQEPIFAARLRPAFPRAERLSSAHDWQNIAPLGAIAQPAKRTPAKSAMSKPLIDQPDLFAKASVRTAKISEAAMAGFRTAQGHPLAHPADASSAASSAQARPRRAKGI